MAEFYQTGNKSSNDFNPKAIIGIGVLVFAIILLVISWKSISVNIPSGHAGVLYRTFGEGTVKDETYPEGFHFIAPWNDMIIYEVREMIIKEKMNVLSSNGLNIEAEMAVNYKPLYSKLGYLHAEIGPNYENRIVVNNLRTVSRTVFGKYTPEEIYSTKKEMLQQEILKMVQKGSEQKFVSVETVSIRSIELPTKLKDAIERKLKQEQEAEEYEFKLVKATKEAQRQKIEAEGKATANRIISASLTDKILKEKGIEATIRLSESNNSKVVVVGGGKDGLPLILGNN